MMKPLPKAASPLEEAIRIAVEAHAGQVDKGGEPYILHPLRLMHQMETDSARIVAVLHDVIEDSTFTVDDLINRGIDPSDATLVDVFLTHRKGQDYGEYIDQLAAMTPRSIPKLVKIADLRDNLRVERLATLQPGDLDRIKRYHAALRKLLATD